MGKKWLMFSDGFKNWVQELQNCMFWVQELQNFNQSFDL